MKTETWVLCIKGQVFIGRHIGRMLYAMTRCTKIAKVMRIHIIETQVDDTKALKIA